MEEEVDEQQAARDFMAENNDLTFDDAIHVCRRALSAKKTCKGHKPITKRTLAEQWKEIKKANEQRKIEYGQAVIRYDDCNTKAEKVERFKSYIRRRIDDIVAMTEARTQPDTQTYDVLVTHEDMLKIMDGDDFHHCLFTRTLRVDPEAIAREYVAIRYLGWNAMIGNEAGRATVYAKLTKWWHGQIQHDKMVLLLFASQKKKLSLSTDLIRQLRPYLYPVSM
jgi:hypothetical protein